MAGPIVQQSCREKSPIRSISMDHVWMPVTALCDNTNTKRSKPHSRRVLVDSSVLLDILTDDPHWAAWSEEKLAAQAERDLLAINPIIYAEVAGHFSTIEELDNVLSPEDFQRLPLPYEAGFLASRCFLLYRRRGGQKHAPLPDFYIGAHAATEGLMLLARDVSRYRTYFPSVQLIAPER